MVSLLPAKIACHSRRTCPFETHPVTYPPGHQPEYVSFVAKIKEVGFLLLEASSRGKRTIKNTKMVSNNSCKYHNVPPIQQ
jgi:hypothetical protein